MKFVPIPDKFINSEPIFEKGGFYLNQTHAQIERSVLSASTSLKYSVSAYTKTFDSKIHFSLYSITGSTSGYWGHAINYVLGYNNLYKVQDYYSLTAFPHIVVFNLRRQDFGDRIALGTLNINQGKLTSITGGDQLLYGNDPNYYLFPYCTNNNEAIIDSLSGTLSGNIVGKLFPFNGFGVFLNSSFSTSALAKTFIDSITSVSWKTDILTTELHCSIVKDMFQLNYSYNPSLLKSSVTSVGSLSGYSYGRDGLTGASSEFIPSISAINTYATTISFYNDLNECLITTKMPVPIRLIKELPYSFRILMDLAIK